MPKTTLTAPGDTVGVNIMKNGTNYTTVRDASAGTNAGNADNKFTLNAKSGSNFFIRRGILLYDFRGVPITRGVRVIKAQLILNDISELAPQTDGDKIRVGWLNDPNTFGTTHANDYSKARYSSQYTSAQQLNNAADGEIVEIDNGFLLHKIQDAINNKSWLHLVVRNQLDYANTTATGNNRVWFDRPNVDDNPLQLRIFYRVIDGRRNQGGGPGGGSASGFGSDSMFGGTSSGFFQF
tara:strand:- start:669 stop:1382 length:714 start_codon:yes stop_codon:yes gene_type:complete